MKQDIGIDKNIAYGGGGEEGWKRRGVKEDSRWIVKYLNSNMP